MTQLIGQLLINGIAMGLVYVILAAGLVFILSITGIFYICYGGFYMLGAYFTWYFVMSMNLPYIPSLIVAFIGVGILGILSYVLIFRRLQVRGEFLGYVVGAMGIFAIIDQADLLIFGTLPKSIPVVFTGTVSALGVTITQDKIALIILGLIITLGLFYMYNNTGIGRAMRAVSFLPEAANLQGISSNRIFFITIAIGTALAGFAGAIIGPSYGIYPSMGDAIIMTIMLIAMFGGMDSLSGACVAGIVVGLILSFGQYFLGGMVQVLNFLIIGVVIYFRPAGLLGRRAELGVTR